MATAEANTAVVAGAVAGALSAVLLLAATIFFICRRAKRGGQHGDPVNIEAVSVGVTSSTREESECDQPKDVFISFRFGEAKAEALALRKALEARNVSVFLSGASPGDDLQDKIAVALDNCRMAVILASKTYGTETNGLFDTGAEMNFVRSHQKPFVLVRMIDFGEDWALSRTKMAFPLSLMQILWLPGTPMPDDLVDVILKKLAKVSRAKLARVSREVVKKKLLTLGLKSSSTGRCSKSSTVGLSERSASESHGAEEETP